jgi:hypothetical protein
MSAPVYPIVMANGAVVALLADRLFPGGVIPQEVTVRPAATYQTISGSPANTLDNHAPVDGERVQIDFWDVTDAAAEAGASAIRIALENVQVAAANGCTVICIGDNGRAFDPPTHQFCASRDYLFQTLR